MTKKNRKYLSKNNKKDMFYDNNAKKIQKLASIEGKGKEIILCTGAFSVFLNGFELNAIKKN